MYEPRSSGDGWEQAITRGNSEEEIETGLERMRRVLDAEVTDNGDSWRIDLTLTAQWEAWVLYDDGRWHIYKVATESEPEGDNAAPPPPADDGDGGALTNVDAGDEPDRLTPPEGDGAAPPANDGDGGDPEQQEVDQPDPEQEKSILQRLIDLANTPPDDGGRSRLQELVTNGDLTGRMDAGDLSIGGGVDLPASDDGAHRSSYHLYYDADDGSYFLRFDDDRTADLSISATAAQVDAALEGLNGITSAEVTGEPGDFTIALIADEPHVLQWGDANLGGDGGLDYLMG